MFIKQLSIFVENKVGRLEAIISALAENEINIRALSLADTSDFGVLRIIVDDEEKAKKVVGDIGVIAKTTDVIAVYVDDKVGGIQPILETLKENSIGISYMYVFLGRTENKALMVLKTEDQEKAVSVLNHKGIKLATKEEI